MVNKKAQEKPSQKKSKSRKRHSGPIRDKERTKKKLIAAVGKVLKKKGYNALTAPNIARECGVDKKLVWAYFGGTENLIRAFLEQEDFWTSKENKYLPTQFEKGDHFGQEEVNQILTGQFATLLENELLRKIIHWELGEKSQILKDLAEERENLGEPFLQVLDAKFANSEKDVRATLALQIAGIYYLSLHAKNNGSTFCGIDINTEEGKARIEGSIRDVLAHLFEENQ